jgi:hypothetical protein
MTGVGAVHGGLKVGVPLHALHIERAVAARVDLSVKDAIANGAVDVAGGVAPDCAVVVGVVQVGEGQPGRALSMIILGSKPAVRTISPVCCVTWPVVRM